MTHLYETTAVNQDGMNGKSYLKDGETYTVSSPLSKAEGTNPEELVGLAMSTCFNSTIKAILKEERIESASKVETTVKLHRETEEPGYYFTVDVYLGIEGMNEEKTARYVEKTKKRCPVAKLMSVSSTVRFYPTIF